MKWLGLIIICLCIFPLVSAFDTSEFDFDYPTPSIGNGSTLNVSDYYIPYIGATSNVDLNLKNFTNFKNLESSGTTASGLQSISFGFNSVASGVYSIVTGRSTIASGDFSSALGDGSIASGITSFAWGGDALATNQYSLAMGLSAISEGYGSSSIGIGSNSSGTGSIAFGGGTISSGSYSTAFGYFTNATGDFSTTLGMRIECSQDSAVCVGGNVSIGGSNPTKEFEVIGDANFTGSLFVGENITMENSMYLNFKNSTGNIDETKIYRASGEALRIHYSLASFVIKSMDNQNLIIKNANNDINFLLNTSTGNLLIGGDFNGTGNFSAGITPQGVSVLYANPNIGVGTGLGRVGILNNNPSQVLSVCNGDFTRPCYVTLDADYNKPVGFRFQKEWVWRWLINMDATNNSDLNIQSGSGLGKVATWNYTTGYLGLFTSSPTHELNVVGSANITENLIVGGNTTSQNVFIPQYIFSHTDENISLAGANEWANVSFSQEDAEIKQGIQHEMNSATNYTYNFTNSGVYYISYDFDIEDESVSSSDIDVAGRLIYFNGTEVIGSVFPIGIQKRGVEVELKHEFLAKFEVGDSVIFQFIADNSNVIITTHKTFGDHPESASIIIKKEANLN